MPAKDLGNKFTCYKCQTKFYDMKKPDPICPKCGADQRESPALKPASESRRGRLAVAKAAEPAAPEAEEGGGLLGEGEEDEELGSFDDEEAESGEEDDV
jgi:uncharacterized protein (TIGR02300 family)